MEFGQAAWLTREGQEVLRPFHVRGSELYSDMTQRRPESALRESALRGASLPSNPDHSSDLAKRNQQIMETLRSRNPLLGQPTRPNTAQGFTNGSTLGEFRPKTRIAGGSVGVDGRRNIKSLPGWRQMFDHADKSFYWLNIKNHSTQWHHPYEQKKTVEKSWDGKKAEVAIRKEKHGIVIGHADHWLNEYQSAPSGATETTRLKTKQTVLAMIHRWSLKWEKISEAFRGMEIRENGEISRAQLRTALIRFNVSYNDSLLEDVWSFLDPSDTGTVKISILTDFVMNNDPLKHKRSGGPSHDRFHGVGTESQEQIQLRNAAEERNNFARSMLLNMTHLQNSLSRGEVAGKMNRLGLTSVLAHTKLTPKNADLIGEFDAYLTELRGGTYTKDDINVETINRFARKYALKLPQGQSQPKKAVIWSPVDGGARKPVIDKLPPDFRPHIQLIREKLFSKYNNPRMAFLHLDKEQKGAIAYAEFKKSVLAMELYVPMIAIDFLWNKIDDDGQGVITYSKFVNFFDNMAKPKKANAEEKPHRKVTDTAGCSSPVYTVTRSKLSRRIRNVEMQKPKEDVNSFLVPFKPEDRMMHTRTEFLSLCPESSALRRSVEVFGQKVDHGANDIFRM